MLLRHQGKAPQIDETAYIAPNAVIAGDVSIGAGTSILFGAVITAESGPVVIGANCVVMENAVLRGVKRHPLTIGDNVLIGPHAHLSGCTVEDNVFIATGVSIFNGAVLESRSVARINCIVHINSVLKSGTAMPIGWIALGNPADLYPPEAGEAVVAHLASLGFSKTVFGLEPAESGESILPTMLSRYNNALHAYIEAEEIQD